MGIPIKPKKCKGLNVAFGFDGCGTESLKRTYGLCDSCLYDFYTTTEVGKVLYKTKRNALNKKNWQEEKKVLKENTKTLSQHEADAKKAFQKWVRLRDEGKNCISCDKPVKDPAGGHFYPAGIYSGLMFNPDNCHLQCNTNCNKHLSGNLLEYRKGLINRFGIEFVDNLDRLSNELRNYKYTKDELIEIKNKYLDKIKNKDFVI